MSKIARKKFEGEDGAASSAFDATAMSDALSKLNSPEDSLKTATPDAAQRPFLGAAEVLSVDGPFVMIRAGADAPIRARLALAVPYEPAIGDQLLAISDGTAAWIIGVIAGSGATRLHLDGDVELAATGVLHLSGGAGVHVTGPDVEVRADRLSMVAGRVTQAYHSVRKTVRELLSVHAGEQHTLVDGTNHAQAKSTRILSEKKVTINGREIFLG